MVLHRSEVTRRLVPGDEQPQEPLTARGDYSIEVFVRCHEAITGCAEQDDGFDQWIAPVVRREPVPFPCGQTITPTVRRPMLCLPRFSSARS